MTPKTSAIHHRYVQEEAVKVFSFIKEKQVEQTILMAMLKVTKVMIVLMKMQVEPTEENCINHSSILQMTFIFTSAHLKDNPSINPPTFTFCVSMSYLSLFLFRLIC